MVALIIMDITGAVGKKVIQWFLDFIEKTQWFYRPLILMSGNIGRRKLTLIPTDSDGYSTRLLKSVSKNGKNMLFLVPLQEQLSIEPLPYDAVEFAKMPLSNCMKCGKKIPLPLLPLHIEECNTTETVGSELILFLPFLFVRSIMLS